MQQITNDLFLLQKNENGRNRHKTDAMILLFYILLALIAAASPSGELDGGQDWSQCPPACKCKWASGKRTADCEAAGLDSLPLFPRPDLIQVLVMDHNPLKTLPPRAFHLTGLINVQKVFMKNCSLHDLDPTALGGLVILIELDLSDNHIKELKQGTFRVIIPSKSQWLKTTKKRNVEQTTYFRLSKARKA